MDTYAHVDIGMIPCKADYKYAWVRYDEAQAEIARLQAALDTAWNDAIEAAKAAAYEWASDNAHNRNKYVDLLYAIRALRKPIS